MSARQMEGGREGERDLVEVKQVAKKKQGGRKEGKQDNIVFP